MPIYDFKNIETGEIVEKTLSYDAKLNYLADNPNMVSIILSTPALVDARKLMGTNRMDAGFADVLKKIHSRTAGSTLANNSSQI